MTFETLTEKLFKERVIVKTSDLVYVEHGIDFTRLRDPETGRLFEVSIKEKIKKKP